MVINPKCLKFYPNLYRINTYLNQPSSMITMVYIRRHILKEEQNYLFKAVKNMCSQNDVLKNILL